MTTTIFVNKTVTTRKSHRCDWCDFIIDAKEKANYVEQVCDGIFSKHYMHKNCYWIYTKEYLNR